MAVEVLSRVKLVERAGSAEKARTLLRAGLFQRWAHDAYVDGLVDDGPELRLAVLRAVLPDGVAVSHRTTLWLLGRDVLGSGPLDVTIPRGRHLAPREGVRFHIAALPDAELVEIDGVLSTSVARAVVDVARMEPLIEAVALGDEALRCGATTVELLLDSTRRSAGLRGVLAARRVLPLLNGRSQSSMESRLRMVLHLGGLTELDVQFDVYDKQGHAGRADLHVRGVLLEFDGRAQRLAESAFVSDRRRQNRLADTGLEIRRFSGTDVYRSPPAVLAATVMRAVDVAEQRGQPRLRSGPDTLPRPKLQPLATLAQKPRSTLGPLTSRRGFVAERVSSGSADRPRP